MNYSRNKNGRFLGIEITLHSKTGEKMRMGDGFLISDGEKVHVWTGKRIGDGKSFLIPADTVRELDIKTLEKATYRNLENGNFETLCF